MTNIITIVAVFIVGLLCGAFIIWLNARLRKRQQGAPPQTDATPQSDTAIPQDAPVFRLRFVIVPIVLAALCFVAAVAFYSSLQSPIAYRFNADGEARNSMNAAGFVIIMAAMQIIGALIAWGTATIIIRMGHGAFKTSAPQFKLDGLITIMSNMILLPQIIVAYLMLDSFIYNVWQRHFIPATYFTIAAIIIGSAIIFVAFILLLSRARAVVSKQ